MTDFDPGPNSGNRQQICRGTLTGLIASGEFDLHSSPQSRNTSVLVIIERVKALLGLSSPIKGQSEEERLERVRALRGDSSPASTGTLLTGLQDRSFEVRLACACALTGRKDKHSCTVLKQWALDDSNYPRQCLALIALNGTDDPDVIDACVKRIDHSTQCGALQKASVIALIGNQDARVLDLMIAASEPDNVLRSLVLKRSGITSQTEEAKAARIRALEDPSTSAVELVLAHGDNDELLALARVAGKLAVKDLRQILKSDRFRKSTDPAVKRGYIDAVIIGHSNYPKEWGQLDCHYRLYLMEPLSTQDDFIYFLICGQRQLPETDAVLSLSTLSPEKFQELHKTVQSALEEGDLETFDGTLSLDCSDSAGAARCFIESVNDMLENGALIDALLVEFAHEPWSSSARRPLEQKILDQSSEFVSGIGERLMGAIHSGDPDLVLAVVDLLNSIHDGSKYSHMGCECRRALTPTAQDIAKKRCQEQVEALIREEWKDLRGVVIPSKDYGDFVVDVEAKREGAVYLTITPETPLPIEKKWSVSFAYGLAQYGDCLSNKNALGFVRITSKPPLDGRLVIDVDCDFTSIQGQGLMGALMQKFTSLLPEGTLMTHESIVHKETVRHLRCGGSFRETVFGHVGMKCGFVLIARYIGRSGSGVLLCKGLPNGDEEQKLRAANDEWHVPSAAQARLSARDRDGISSIPLEERHKNWVMGVPISPEGKGE